MSRFRYGTADQNGWSNSKKVFKVTLHDGGEDTDVSALIPVQSRCYRRGKSLRPWQSRKPLLLDSEYGRVTDKTVKVLFAILTLPLVLGLSGCGDSHEGDSPRKKAAT